MLKKSLNLLQKKNGMYNLIIIFFKIRLCECFRFSCHDKGSINSSNNRLSSEMVAVFFISQRGGKINGSTMLRSRLHRNNKRDSGDRKSNLQIRKKVYNMFALTMAITTKVAVTMFLKGAGAAITLLCTGSAVRNRKRK